MAPNVTSSPTEVLCTPETTLHSSSEIRAAGVKKSALKYRREIVWPNVVMHIYLNLAALYGIYLMLTSAKILTGIWGMCKC
jgi:stearoyl-CoA desaturase (delta-9 desaturase)